MFLKAKRFEPLGKFNLEIVREKPLFNNCPNDFIAVTIRILCMICTIPGAVNNKNNVPNKPDDEHRKINLKTKITVATSSKPTLKSVTTPRSQSSSVKSVKSFTTVSKL